MKRLAVAVLLCASLLFLNRQDGIELEVSAGAARPARRIGVNLGSWTSWGAEQLSANVLKNPGFEPVADGAILIVSTSTSRTFTDDTSSLARPSGFWDGGSYSIRTGPLAGADGKILHSRTIGGLMCIEANGSVEGLRTGDAIALRTVTSTAKPAGWWYGPGEDSEIQADGESRRPGTRGSQSLRLTPRASAARVSSYLDAIGARAGKLLPLAGQWELRLWARASSPAATLRVTVQRQGSPPLVDEHAALAYEWQELCWRFSPSDSGPAETLELRFEASAHAGSVWLDDASLRRIDTSAGAFRAEALAALQEIRPGYLRDWQGQAGDTFRNRTAPADSRMPFRYRPGGDEAADTAYSLPEFLDLCQRAATLPWVVLPTTMTDSEWIEAGRYLSEAAGTYGFSEIVVEFGNENWNPVFRPAGIPDPNALAAAARRAFTLLGQGAAGDPRLRTTVGSQFTSSLPPVLPSGESLAGFAPYWAFQGHPGGGLEQLFADETASLERVSRQPSAIYEMNAHLLDGSIRPEEANRIVTSRAAGTAMAWHAIAALSAGVDRQCAYALAGFDAFGEGRRLVRLFGLARDLAGAVRLRPTGQALAMLNRAAAGEATRVETSSPDLQAIAFRQRGVWQLAVASKRNAAAPVRIRFPGAQALPSLALSLGGGDSYASNEEEQQVTEQAIPLRKRDRVLEFELPPYGFAVLLNGEKQNGH